MDRLAPTSTPPSIELLRTAKHLTNTQWKRILKEVESCETIVIVGSGCAGLTAAIYAARAQQHPLVLEGDQPGGLLTQTTQVENFPGFPNGIQGMELMQAMHQQAERFGARFLSTTLQGCQLGPSPKILTIGDGTIINAKTVILATGSKPNLLHLPNETALLGGKGLSVCATCDGFFYKDETVCVIGGGDSACEEALYLSAICSNVYLIHRRDTLRASAVMAQRVLDDAAIKCVWNATPVRYETDDNGFISGLTVDVKNDRQTIPCKGIFLAIGWNPNTQPFSNQLELDDKGFIQIAERNVCTALPGVFAAGDCVDRHYRQASVAAGMGVQAALEAERWLKEHP